MKRDFSISRIASIGNSFKEKAKLLKKRAAGLQGTAVEKEKDVPRGDDEGKAQPQEEGRRACPCRNRQTDAAL